MEGSGMKMKKVNSGKVSNPLPLLFQHSVVGKIPMRSLNVFLKGFCRYFVNVVINVCMMYFTIHLYS